MDFSWSRAKNAESLAKATTKKEKAEANLRKTQEALRDEDIQRLAEKVADRVSESQNPKEAVRALVEGEVYTYSAEARRASDEIAQLDLELPRLQGELVKKRPGFETAWRAHASAMAEDVAISGMDKRLHAGTQSGWAVAAAIAVLVVLEAIFQRRPIELIVRNTLPELSNTPIFLLALLSSVLIITLTTTVLFYAAKSWGEYSVRSARANETLRDGAGTVVGEHVSPVGPLLATVITAVLQVGLFLLRFQTGTSDATTHKNLIYVSALVMFSAAGVALLEFRRARAQESAAEVPQTRAEDRIDEFMALHRAVYATIPQQKRDLERRRLQEINYFLRELQRLGDRGGVAVRDAVNSLVAENEEAERRLTPIVYDADAVTRGLTTGSPAPIGNSRHTDSVVTDFAEHRPRPHSVSDDTAAANDE